jgi:arylsulfatase A-like enzyme
LTFTRLAITRLFLGTLLLFFTTATLADETNPVRPNILLVLLDDVGYSDIGAFSAEGNSHTPNLDNLASEGTRFTRHYAETVCAPARASLLTGRSAASLGYRAAPRGISPEILTLPKSLSEEGYRTHFIGKWLKWLGPDPEPSKQGFDSFMGFLSPFHLKESGKQSYFTRGNATYHDPWLETEYGRQQYQGHLSDLLAQNAISKIREYEGGAPWFINYWSYATHFPVEPADRVAESYPDSPEGRYHALLNQLDWNLGRVFSELEKTGQAGNTIVVVVSDNGGINAATDSNAPYFGSKKQFLEGSTRTPMIIRWPEHFPRGGVIEDIVSLTDILPTLATAAGARLPQRLDGFDLAPLAEGGKLPTRMLAWERFADSHYAFGMLSEDGRWRVATPQVPANPASRIKFELEIEKNGTILELYDLEKDPTGSTNVAADHPAILNQLTHHYHDWHKQNRTVSLNSDTSSDAVLMLTGDSLQRTPGQGGFTFAMSVSAGDEKLVGPAVLASQNAVWKLSTNESGRLDLNFLELEITGQMMDVQDCNSVIVTGQFHNRHFAKLSGHKAIMSLYFNGKMLDQKRFPHPTIPRESLMEPTLILPKSENLASLEIIDFPVILNTEVTDDSILSVGELHSQLCGNELDL